MKRKTFPILVVAILGLATITWAQDQGREFHWTGKLAADKIVEIKNINGSIEAAPASGDEIEVSAEKTGPKADQIKIEVVPSGDGVTICTIYPSSVFGGSSGPCESGSHWHSSNIHGDNTKVNFTVKLPKNLRFGAQTVNGAVTAEDLGRFVRASSVNGSVRVSTAAWAQIDTVNGSINASMGNAGWDGTLKIDTVNGSVKIELPDDLNTDIKFSSVNGRISSDFPITISGGFVGHSARGTIGKGGRTLVIETVNGSVDLKKGRGSI
jgi:hypothetical protein